MHTNLTTTLAHHTTEHTVAWIVFPIVLVGTLYLVSACWLWTHVRIFYPVWLFLLAFFFPPLFFVLFGYILVWSVCLEYPYPERGWFVVRRVPPPTGTGTAAVVASGRAVAARPLRSGSRI